MVVSIVLERNPELEFSEKVDLDVLVKEAFHDFQKDRSLEGMNKLVGACPTLSARLTESKVGSHHCHASSLEFM
jgi:hypothetical protein